MKPFLAFISLFIIVLNVYSQKNWQEYSEETIVMGTTFEVKAISSTFDSAYTSVKMAINEARRIDTLLSHHLSNSETSLINNYASQHPVIVSREVINLIQRTKKISDITHGAFDISFAVMSRFWHFNSQMKELPNPDSVAYYKKLINYKDILINSDSCTVRFRQPGMKIGFGGIGQGYAAECCRKIMQKYGIRCGYVNVSGDIRFWGIRPDGKLWRVALVSPDNTKDVIAWLDLTDAAVVTSGDYEQYVMIGGKRYTHIFDPRTGYPADGMRSVAIISPDTEVADGLSTGTFVLGEKDGLALINTLKNINCVIVTNDNRIITSDKLKINFTPVKNIDLFNKKH
jgi:FAD:protein FMN transferase